MKRLAILVIMLSASLSAFAQVQITTKKEKLSDFTTRTMKVVLSGNEFVDTALRDAVNNTWSISPFEFCSMEEFGSLKANEEYYFLVPVKVRFKGETSYNIYELDLVKGKKTAKNVNDMLEVVSMPVCAADEPSGREAAMLPGLIDILQGYITQSLQTKFSSISSYARGLHKSAGKTAVIADEEISAAVGSDYRSRIGSKKMMEITDGDSADNLFINQEDNAVVSYVIAPGNPQKGSMSWKMLIDVRTHELYFYQRCKIKSPTYVGWSKADLKKIAKTR